MSFGLESPFARLRRLLDDAPPGLPPIDMTIGAPQHPIPAQVGPLLAEKTEDFAHYPPITGTPALRKAIRDWLVRRYPSLAGQVVAERHILPLCGSREGLFSAVFPAIWRKKTQKKPKILIPNPFYQVYGAAAEAAGAEPVFLPAEAEAGFLPDLTALAEKPELLRETVAFYLCSPANPQGAVAEAAYVAQAIDLARHYNFMLFLDECYSEIFYDVPPPGGLEVAQAKGEGFSHVVSFQSLSKRSNVPGLRSGFCAGDPDFLADFARFRNVAAPQMPLPIQHVSAVLWSEETHVTENRARYRAKFDLADRILENRFGYRRPQGGFFLWLDMSEMGGGERAAETLWKQCGVKVLPGAYLAAEVAGADNPGQPYVRLALVHDLPETEEALRRIVRQFD